MDATTAAPTITIDGVTSNPGVPITMLELACGCHAIRNGHDVAKGDIVECVDSRCEAPSLLTTVKSLFQTWMF